MKKQLKKLAIQVDKENQKIYLVETIDETLSKARFFEEDVVFSPLINSTILKGICTLLRKAQLNNQYKYEASVILPNSLFEREIIKVKNSLLNNFYIKRNLLAHYHNSENIILNYKKIETQNEFIVYEVCFIKKDIYLSLLKLQKQFNIKISQILDEKLAEANFLKNNNKINKSSFILVAASENKFTLNLILEHENKKTINIARERIHETSTFDDLCKSLMVSQKFLQEKKEVFDESVKVGEIDVLFKQIKVLQNGRNLSVILNGIGASKILLELKKFDCNINVLLMSNLLGAYASFNNIILLGALYKFKPQKLNLFYTNKLNNFIKLILNFWNNLKVYFIYFKNKITSKKNKNLKIKEV